MSKKLISILLAVCILFCLSACGATETSSNPTNTPSESQTDITQDTDENTLGEENSQVSSNTEETNENDTTQTQTQTNQSKPTSTTNQPTHTHSYSNATCTSPKKCSCGATAGTALGHQFSSATCTSPQICSRCGTTSGNALGHSYSAANCNSPKTCTRCGQTSGSALGHNYVNNKCSRCGKVDPDSLPKDLFNAHPPYETKGCSNNAVKINGESFANAFVMTGGYADGSGAHAYFNLGGKYSTLTFEVGHVDGSYMEDETLEIILDGVTVKTINLKANELKRQYTISIVGTNQLVIKQSYTVAKYAIINSQLKK